MSVFDHPHGLSGGFVVRSGYSGVRVLILYRNLTRTDFDPNTLKYRLIDSNRHVYKPDPKFGVGPLLNQPPKAVARNVLGRIELAFGVRAHATGLKLLFRVKPKVGMLITVPLSSPS